MFQFLVWPGFRKPLSAWQFFSVSSTVLAFLFIAFFSSSVWADKFHDRAFLGEYNPSDYFGPLFPAFKKRLGLLRDYQDLDQAFSQKYVQEMTDPEIAELEYQWFYEIPGMEICPNIELGANLDFIRYLYRLLATSYLYEGILDIHQFIRKAGGVMSSCPVKPDILFENCSPKYVEFKKFIDRAGPAYARFVKDVEFAQWKNSEFQATLSDIRQGKSSSVAGSLLHSWCKDNNCEVKNKSSMIKKLDSECSKYVSMISNICNERDSLYGLSSIKEAKILLLQSNTFTIINQLGQGEGCLRRFKTLFQDREIVSHELKTLFSLVFKKLIKGDYAYTQGRLFLPGALKEFDDHGLMDFLYVKTDTPVKKVAQTVVVPSKKIRSKKIVKVAVEKPQPVVVVTPTPAPTPVPHISQFELASRERRFKNLDSVAVNMELMRKDNPFGPKLVFALAEPIRKFQTRKALEDMKQLDSLGTKQAPVHLMFLKFLIENDYHQGLFNIQSILGTHFWIINDLESKKYPEYIMLANDQSTQFKWQIYILRPI